LRTWPRGRTARWIAWRRVVRDAVRQWLPRRARRLRLVLRPVAADRADRAGRHLVVPLVAAPLAAAASVRRRARRHDLATLGPGRARWIWSRGQRRACHRAARNQARGLRLLRALAWRDPDRLRTRGPRRVALTRDPRDAFVLRGGALRERKSRRDQ